MDRLNSLSCQVPEIEFSTILPAECKSDTAPAARPGMKPLSLGSWCGDFARKVGRSQDPKILHVERIDAIAFRLLRTAQVDSVMNPASGPTTGGTVANDLLVFLRVEGHQFHVRENHLLNDLPRFTWVQGRLERGSGQHRVNLGQAMGANKSPMLPADQFLEDGECRCVVGMPRHRRRHEHRGVKIPVHRPHALRIRSSRSSSIAFRMS